MLNQWMRRLQQFIGGSEPEREEEEYIESERTYKYGRVESDKRKSESKIMYQYPKTGQFRFPVIDDQPKRNKRIEIASEPRSRKQKPRPEPKMKKQQETVSKPEFKLTSIPSPVYGFQERTTTKSVMSDSLSVSPFEKKSHQSTSDILQTVIERAEEELIIDSGNEEVAATTEWVEEKAVQINTSNLSTDDNEIEIKEDIREELKEEEVKSESVEQQPKDIPQQLDSIYKLVDSSFSTQAQSDEELSIATKEEQPFKEVNLDPVVEIEEKEKEKVSDLYEEEKTDVQEEEIMAENNRQVVEKEDKDKQEQGFLEQVDEKEEQKEPLSEQESSKPKEATRTSKSPIPFNVMMLPQDQQKKQVPQIKEEVLSQPTYAYPSIQLLNYPEVKEQDESEWLEEQGAVLEETLQSFSVDAKVVHTTKGPSVTRFEIQPGRGVKVTKITGLTDDIKLALAAKDIRIEAPIPGKNTIGIEVPNRTSTPVFLREILRRNSFIRSDSPLTVALGLDISGQPIVTDLKKMPHGLVAGATGSGKSVCINSVLVSLLFKATPDEVKLMLIDPKMVELAPYNGLPHLVTPVITDAKQATAALKWVVLEMERRYELFSQKGVRDVGRYNDLYSESPDQPALPFILVVIDELADLMMVSPQEVEDAICRIAQKARACGIHLLLATQRPSVDVITGLIKANIPTRIAFSVSSQTDSRTILDMGGAERLLGKGDMLFHENGSPKPVRVQGTFVSDQEIEDVVAHVKKQREPNYLLEIDQLKHVVEEVDDEHFEEACYYVIEQGSASASSLQRKFRVGYNRAARLIDLMEERGIVSQAMGSKPRHVLVDTIELEEILYHQES